MKKRAKAYRDWVLQLKERIRSSQIKAVLKVNTELICLYWELGEEILQKEKETGWGDNLIEQLSKDLTKEFPAIKGFSRTNLFYIKRWYLFYNQPLMVKNAIAQIVPQLVALFPEMGKMQPLAASISSFVTQLVAQIPWGHNREIITKCENMVEGLFYVTATLKNNWSRNVLIHQIESKLWERQGKAITNFELTLPTPQSDLAHELIKDPYKFDFLNLYKEYKERDLEKGLVDNLTRFLLELGAGFSFIGRQYPIKVGNKDFTIDLLFYHYKLHCFVVVELKAGEFMPEYAGKLNFYLNVINGTVKQQKDNPTIGILICRQRDKVVAEYALQGINNPIGVSEYHLTQALPDNLKDSLPAIDELEDELREMTEQTT